MKELRHLHHMCVNVLVWSLVFLQLMVFSLLLDVDMWPNVTVTEAEGSFGFRSAPEAKDSVTGRRCTPLPPDLTQLKRIHKVFLLLTVLLNFLYVLIKILSSNTTFCSYTESVNLIQV